jgi:hypothetical protein
MVDGMLSQPLIHICHNIGKMSWCSRLPHQGRSNLDYKVVLWPAVVAKDKALLLTPITVYSLVHLHDETTANLIAIKLTPNTHDRLHAPYKLMC